MAKSRVVGLDLGSHGVRAAEVESVPGRPDARARLLRFGEEPVDPDAMRDGEVARASAVTTALRTLWRRERFSTKDVVLGMGNQRVFVRDLSLPPAPLEQLRASLRFGPVQELLPVKVEDCLLDFSPVGTGSDGSVHGLLVAVPEETVEANTSAVAAAGLRPVRVDLNAFGLLRALVHGQLRQEVVGIVDVGAAITDVLVVDQGVLRLYRTLPTGSAAITSAVRQALAVPESTAEELKRVHGLVGAGTPGTAPVAEAAMRHARSLSEAVHASFAFAASASGRPVERLLLAGRGALMPGLGQYLSTTLGVPAAFATADAHLELARGVDPDRMTSVARPVLPVSVGLALGGAA